MALEMLAESMKGIGEHSLSGVGGGAQAGVFQGSVRVVLRV